VAYDNNEKKMESVYSQRIRAGKRRTYFFDIRETRGNDYYLTITESRKKFNEDGYDRHKIFLYKEDFNKFLKGMTEAIDFVKTDLMPDFDFDAFNHDNAEGYEGNNLEGGEKEISRPEETSAIAPAATPEITDDVPEIKSGPTENIQPTQHEEVDKW
jgi:Protein of unknown function (DUF3276)